MSWHFRSSSAAATAPTQTLQRIHVAGRDFFTSDGKRHTIIGSSELLLAYVFDTQGRDAIRPVLQQRSEIGFNNLRVLWQKDVRNAGVLWQMPTSKMVDFLALCEEYGFYVQGTILADCQAVNPTLPAQLLRVEAVRAATRGIANHIEQLGNEAFKNGHDPRNFLRPTDRLAASSSGPNFGDSDFHASDVWDFFCFSGDRSPEQKAIREYGPMEVMYDLNKPAICDEGAKPGLPYTDPRIWESMGAQAASGAGGRFHAEAGTGTQNPSQPVSRLFNNIERTCAEAFVWGAKGR